ncbi:MAG: metallophosphoesterase [Bdellovibrionia bacterium]
MKWRYWAMLSVLPLLLGYTVYQANSLLPGKKTLAWIVGCGFFLLLTLSQFLLRLDLKFQSSPAYPVLVGLSAFGMGVWATYLLFSLPLDLGNSLLALFQRFDLSPVQPERREFFVSSLKTALVGLSGGMAGLGFYEVVQGPQVKEVSVPLPNLPKELHGLKIAQISDLHVGGTIGSQYVENVVKRVLGLSPDLIAVTGDLVDGIPETLSSKMTALAQLKAPLGTFYVTGNHEYYWGAEQWIQKVTELGFTPLMNSNRVLQFQGKKLLVAGVTDTSAHQFIPDHQTDPKKARLSDQDCDFKLLLAHRPDSCFEAEPLGYDLQLSGHTHAGQFFPWSILVSFAHRYLQGLNRHGRMWVYVNAGTGYWGPPNRLINPSEITLIRLVSSSGVVRQQDGKVDPT